MRELKWDPEQPVELSVLGDGTGTVSPGDIARQCVRILELSGKRMRLAAERPVSGGAAVRLEWEAQLVLGQVLNAEPGGFWMEIHHILLDNDRQSWQKQGWQRG